jgi:hypothetical protein
VPTFPHDADIDLARLLADDENPRVPNDTRGPHEALLRMAEHQGSRLPALCAHIAKYGLNPAQRFIVIPNGRDFVVLDGNRRLTALRALDTPTTFPALPAGRLQTIKRIAAEAAIPRTVPCVVFGDRLQANPWIELTHLNQRGGVSLSRWSSQQKAAHEERLGRPSPANRLLTFVRSSGLLSDAATELIDRGSFRMSMIDRMLETKDVRPLLGVDIKDGELQLLFPRDQVLRPLTKFIDDVATGLQTSRSLNTVKQRTDYLSKFAADERPDPVTELEVPVPFDEAPETTEKRSTRKAARKRDRASGATRPFLVPDTVRLQIPHDRVHRIYLELKTVVRVDDAANATGALYRMLLEMSLVLGAVVAGQLASDSLRQVAGTSSLPRLTSTATACSVVSTPSRSRTASRWFRTVSGEMPSSCAAPFMEPVVR